MVAILFLYHLKTELQNIQISNGFGFGAFRIQAPQCIVPPSIVPSKKCFLTEQVKLYVQRETE